MEGFEKLSISKLRGGSPKFMPTKILSVILLPAGLSSGLNVR